MSRQTDIDYMNQVRLQDKFLGSILKRSTSTATLKTIFVLSVMTKERRFCRISMLVEGTTSQSSILRYIYPTL